MNNYNNRKIATIKEHLDQIYNGDIDTPISNN